MKYSKWSKERIKLGNKRLTSRSNAFYNDKDVDYVVGPLPWKFIRDFLWRDEGAVNKEEMIRRMNQIQRRRVKDDKPFFVHVLKNQEDYNKP